MADRFKPALKTPFQRDLEALCGKHGVTKLVCGFEDPDQAGGQTTVFVLLRSGAPWAFQAADDIWQFIQEHTNADDTWRT